MFIAGTGFRCVAILDDLETDLGIDQRSAVPGTGRLVDTLRSFLYVSPIAFHYIRYYVG